jgi:ABC transporter substrate binding protein
VKRREFIRLVGGAAAAWPLAVQAQAAMPVIGFLRSTSLAVSKPMIAGFRQGLTAAGFNEGQNVAIEYRHADNQLERLPGLVAELIRLPVAVIVGNISAALAAKAATTTVPIVFATGSDPVVDGLVAAAAIEKILTFKKCEIGQIYRGKKPNKNNAYMSAPEPLADWPSQDGAELVPTARTPCHWMGPNLRAKEPARPRRLQGKTPRSQDRHLFSRNRPFCDGGDLRLRSLRSVEPADPSPDEPGRM